MIRDQRLSGTVSSSGWMVQGASQGLQCNSKLSPWSSFDQRSQLLHR